MSHLSRRGFTAGMLSYALQASTPEVLRSPDGNVELQFSLDASGAPLWSLIHRRQPVLLDSPLGFVLDDGTRIDKGWKVIRTARRRVRASWKPVYGERENVADRYDEWTVVVQTGAAALPQMELVFRAYDEGAAVRYRFGATHATVAAELTGFRFPTGSIAYEEHGTEGEYSRAAPSAIQPDCERPLTVALPGGAFASIGEAALDDYPRMLLSVRDSCLSAALSGPAKLDGAAESPWRWIVVGRRPGELLERNDLVLNLNSPCALRDTSWIRPGKVIREVTLSTKGGKACVDFAVDRGLQYIEYDAGWYGHEYDDASDATAVSPDPKRIGSIPNHGGLDLQEVIRYGRERGIGSLLYVNRRALERQLNDILPLYVKWGVKGIKFGFVNSGPQRWTSWLLDAVRKCAEHRLMVDIHDAYRPTGFSRTYPNLLTQEGIRGNEHMPTAAHNCTLPFTRYIAGAGDYTICVYTNRLKTTRTHQLALAVTHYSPLQFMYWYDQPSQYGGEPELEFLRHVPTVWSDTRVIHGEIGEFATIARRSGREWYVGSINNEQERTIEIPFAFLDSGSYAAEIYEDSGIRRLAVSRKTVLRVAMRGSGGSAVRIVPDVI